MLLLRRRRTLACTPFQDTMGLPVTAGEHGKRKAGCKKPGGKQGRDFAQKRGGAAGSEYGGRSTAAEGSTGIGTLAVLNQDKPDQGGGDDEMSN